MITKEVKELMSLFKGSFINEINELILVPETNLYFKLNDAKTRKDLIYKIIAWCSRDVAKSKPDIEENKRLLYTKNKQLVCGTRYLVLE